MLTAHSHESMYLGHNRTRARPSAAVCLVLLFSGTFLGGQATKPLQGEADRTRLWVRLSDDQGMPVTARVYLRDEAGTAYAPEASLVRETRFGESYFHARGHFQLEVPPGEVTIEATKGFEYIPVKTNLQLRYLELQDRTTAVNLVLKRMIDMPALGWYSGDVHMHPNHRIGGVYMTMEDCLLVAAGEDIRVASLLISNRQGTTRVFDTEYFLDGAVDPASSEESMLVVQEEFRNTTGMYGHIILLGIKKLIRPFFTGIRPNLEDYPPNFTIAQKARDQGGVISYAHPAEEADIPVGLHIAREFPVDLALGVVDALDLLSNMDEEAATWMYYRVLNCGLKCTASAGTDSQMDVMRAGMPGGGKVYVKINEPPLTYEKWLEGFRAGRTFVSNGPLLFLEVEGKEPGQELHFSGPTAVRISARAQSLVPMKSIELIVNGKVVSSAKPNDDGSNAALTHTLELEKSSWIAARVSGEGHRWVVNDRNLFAHTSPVYVHIDGRPIASREDSKIVVQWIDRLIEDVRSSPRFFDEQKRSEVVELFERARRYYEEIGSE